MKEKLQLSAAMFIFGTLGIFAHFLPWPSAIIACCRAVLGSLFLLFVMFIRKTIVHGTLIRENAVPLFLSGAAVGFNWVFLFEAYRNTTVAVATVCYYMAPVFVILLSPLVLKEKLTMRRLMCAFAAFSGVALISGTTGGIRSIAGIAWGLAAAVMYCSIVLLNKKISGPGDLEKTFFQLSAAAIVMVAYVLCTQKNNPLHLTPMTISLMLVLGIVHSGIVYLLFFSAIGKLPAQTTSILSYIDPVTAVILSAFILKQPVTLTQILGMCLILGAALISELFSTGTDTCREN